MNKSLFNHFMDILYFLPRKAIFSSKAEFISVLETEAKKYEYEKFLPQKDMAKLINRFLKDLSNNLVITENKTFGIEQLDAFKVLASVSVLKESSLIRNRKKAIAKKLISKCISYTDVSVSKPALKSEQIMEVAKRYQNIHRDMNTLPRRFSDTFSRLP